MFQRWIVLFFLVLFGTLGPLGQSASAEVLLPSVFGDHMVLQRDVAWRAWGKAKPGEQVTVELTRKGPEPNRYNGVAEANEQGDWSMMMLDTPAGEPWTMTITGSQTGKPIVINDVVFGEVWVASGQSNMAWTVAQSADAANEIAGSANDQVRMWTADRTVAMKPAFDVPGSWAVASPETTGDFSAVAYYFARKLQGELGVPIGVLHSSWGGTPVEAWTSRARLEETDSAGPILQRFDAAVKAFPKARARYDRDFAEWQRSRLGPDNTGHQAGYAKPDFDDSGWKTMTLPQPWEEAGLDKDGVVWFRKTIDLPEGWAGKPLTLSLGPIDDGDTTYVNNTQVGQTPGFHRGAWQTNRVYQIPADLVKGGKLTFAVRVVDYSGAGGIWGQPEQLTVARKDDPAKSVSLAGQWTYQHTHEINRIPQRPSPPFGPDHPHSPAGLYNGMIAPIVPYTIAGAIWYQGESNASRAEQYQSLFPAMINDWRNRWNCGEFPFLFVQLANYRQPTDAIVDPDWAHLREAQRLTLDKLTNTGMAVTIDIGEANDIHPRNKQDVGKRLARLALADTYGKDGIVKSGPSFLNAERKRGTKMMDVWFNNHGSRLIIKGDGSLQGFTIAGKDGKFVKANAKFGPQILDNEQMSVVVVWSDDIVAPAAVRYAWEDNPDEANLFNEAGLPASPFRSDDFAGPTDGRR